MSLVIMPWFEKLATRFNAYAKRERALLAMVAVGGTLLLGFSLLVEPELLRAKNARNLLVQQKTELVQAQAQLVATQTQLSTDPDAAKKAELATLKDQLSNIEGALRKIEGGLVPPEQMNVLLERMLARHASLRLLSFKSFPPVNLADQVTADSKAAGAEKKQEPATESRGPGLYKHGVELKLEGGYAELYAWLAQLEAAPQKLLWGEVKLNVTVYPKAVLTVTVFTLSSDKAWLTI